MKPKLITIGIAVAICLAITAFILFSPSPPPQTQTITESYKHANAGEYDKTKQYFAPALSRTTGSDPVILKKFWDDLSRERSMDHVKIDRTEPALSSTLGDLVTVHV